MSDSKELQSQLGLPEDLVPLEAVAEAVGLKKDRLITLAASDRFCKLFHPSVGVYFVSLSAAKAWAEGQWVEKIIPRDPGADWRISREDRQRAAEEGGRDVG